MEGAKEDRSGDEDKENSTSSSPVSSSIVPCALLPGENVSHIGKTRDRNCIVLSNYRLHVGANDEYDGPLVNVALSCIESVEAKDLFFVQINCKDGKYYRVSFGDNSTCEDWHQRLLVAINPVPTIDDSFAFVHYQWALEAQFEELEEDNLFTATDGICDTFRHEVTRLGFDVSGAWRISSINKDLTFCQTYPPEILVPACISDQVLEKVASFRSARRVPAVVWRHVHTGAVLARCSQPEVGWLGWRSADDEDLVRAVADASAYDQPGAAKDTSSNGDEERNDISSDGVPSLKDLSAEVAAAVSNNSKVLIVDARSYPAAVGNRARGGGVECIEYYPFAEIIFMSLGNIHNIRKSFQALRSLCNQTPQDTFSGGAGWLAALDATKWLYHASGLLKAASRVASALHNEGRPVLVHCSDGWDRTPQIVSLAQIMLDPYYRSIDGFRTLVEICWLDFGHKMADRNGTVLGTSDPNERAPIFLQWLDCVHQLLLQFPCDFEFNLSFLVKLAQHTFSSMFGTFLCNSLLERRRNRISQKTRSVWDYLEHHHVKFRNFLYESRRLTKDAVDPMWPRCEVRDLLLWKDVYVVSDQKVAAVVPPPSLSNGSCQNSASTASSSGLNSRCDDAPMPDTVDSSGANSSREDDGNPKNGPPPRSEMKKVHDELERLERSGSLSNENPASPRSSLTSAAMAQLRLGRAIESSTDTLVADADEKRSNNITDDKSDETKTSNGVSDNKTLSLPDLPVAPEDTSGDESSVDQQKNGKIPSAENNGGCPSNCLMGCDLSQYFKEPIDTDGLTAHHNQVQERLVRIFASHQAEVQALRRDLQCTRVALFKQKSLAQRGDELLAVDIDAKVINGAASSGPNVNSGSSSTGACSDASSTWEAVDEKEANPTMWIPDHAVAACMKCNTNFWFGRRKHHCRSCGFLFCRDCSSRMIPIPSEQLYHPVRVCDDCFALLDAKRGETNNLMTTSTEDVKQPPTNDETTDDDNKAFPQPAQ